jgi:hypothetical protein
MLYSNLTVFALTFEVPNQTLQTNQDRCKSLRVFVCPTFPSSGASSAVSTPLGSRLEMSLCYSLSDYTSKKGPMDILAQRREGVLALYKGLPLPPSLPPLPS